MDLIIQKLRAAYEPDQIVSKRSIKKSIDARASPVDYTYGRLYDEKRFYLNKSGSKFITLGVRPDVCEFKREIRLQSGGIKPFTLLLERHQLGQLYRLIKELPEILIDNAEYAEDFNPPEEESEGPQIKLAKTSLGDNIFKLIMPDEQYMFLGVVSLQKLVDFEAFIFSVYDEMDVDYLKKLFDGFTNECMHLNYEDYTFDYVIRIFLFQTAMTAWDDRPFYSQTYIHFVDFVVAHITSLRNKQI